MLMLHSDPSEPRKDPMDVITDSEREKMKKLESKRGTSMERYLTFSPSREPSVVLDNFLFLGSMQHATDQILLQRFQISKFTDISYTNCLFMF
jgi:hypothetical protein